MAASCNGISLIQAKENFKSIGTCHKDMINNVRLPELNEYDYLSGEVKWLSDYPEEEYGTLAQELADSYEEKLSEIVKYILPEVNDMFGAVSESELTGALGIPQINLDQERISYLEQTLDSVHIIDVEFSGIFDEFYEVSIDG